MTRICIFIPDSQLVPGTLLVGAGDRDSGYAFHPQLLSHKLKGESERFLGCAVGYDLGIVFQFPHVARHDSS